MDTAPIINVTVLECHPWSTDQKLIKISENDFSANKMDRKKRVVKREPECWIYVDTSVTIPPGKVSLMVRVRGDWENYIYEEEEDVNELITSLSTLTIHRGEEKCKHLFRANDVMRILFCEKCGTMIRVDK